MKQKSLFQKMLYVSIGLLIILFLVVWIKCCSQVPALSEYESDVNRIKEIEYSARQKELNALVEEGKMNVNYSAEAVFKGKISENFNVKNIKNNHHPIIFELFDEDGVCLYQSKKIAPGYEISQIELNKELEKGTHMCKLKVGYAEEGNVSSAFPITIEVK